MRALQGAAAAYPPCQPASTLLAELVSSLAPLGRKSCDFAADFGKLS
jgi:hypothetical protein